jgi:hypothetical protein
MLEHPSKQKKSSLSPWLTVAVIMFFVGGFLLNSQKEAKNNSSNESYTNESAVVTREKVDYKITEESLTDKFLSNLEENLLIDFKRMIKNDEVASNMTMESSYINKNGYKLALINILGGPDSAAVVYGFDKDNGDLIQVFCSNPKKGIKINIDEGKCGSMIKNQFHNIHVITK